jgi:hypothetical protein
VSKRRLKHFCYGIGIALLFFSQPEVVLSQTSSQSRIEVAQAFTNEHLQFWPKSKGDFIARAIGVDHGTIEIRWSEISQSYIRETFSAARGEGARFFRAGFKLVIFTNGKTYWGAQPGPDGFKNGGGPFDAAPSLSTLLGFVRNRETQMRTSPEIWSESRCITAINNFGSMSSQIRQQNFPILETHAIYVGAVRNATIHIRECAKTYGWINEKYHYSLVSCL